MRGRKARVPHGARLNKGLSTTRPLRPDKIRVIKSRLAERAKVKPATDAGRRTPDAGRRTPDAGRRTPDAGRLFR